MLGAALLWKAPRETLLGFAPAALLVAVAALAPTMSPTTACGPPYMHRSRSDPADNWYDYTYERDGRVRESYWSNPVGVDRGEPSVAKYALHATVGHHGVFSLTPIWLLSIWGVVLLWRGRRFRELALMIAVLSLVCLTFYILRPADRPKLRRHDQRLSLDVLVRAVVAGGAVAGGRSAEPFTRGPRGCAGAVGDVGVVGQLSDVESLDASLAVELAGVFGMDAVAGYHAVPRQCRWLTSDGDTDSVR